MSKTERTKAEEWLNSVPVGGILELHNSDGLFDLYQEGKIYFRHVRGFRIGLQEALDMRFMGVDIVRAK